MLKKIECRIIDSQLIESNRIQVRPMARSFARTHPKYGQAESALSSSTKRRDLSRPTNAMSPRHNAPYPCGLFVNVLA